VIDINIIFADERVIIHSQSLMHYVQYVNINRR